VPELFRDIPLINILLSEAIAYTHIEEKVEALTDLVHEAMKPLIGANASLSGFTRDSLRTSLVVFFLGIMNTVRIARSSSLGIGEKDVVAFVTLMAEKTLNLGS